MKVSVIVPCYNSEKWIEKCLVSIKEQTYADIEIIFVDNESTDRSVDVVEGLGIDNLLVSSAPNIYPNCWDEAREVGFEMATGEYLTTVGSDDFLEPHYIEKCLSYIQGARQIYPESAVLAVQSPIMGVSDNPNFNGKFQMHAYTDMESFKEQCLVHCPVNSPTVFLHRSLYESGLLETFPEKYGGAADYDLYCRLADNGILIHPSPHPLGYNYRWHEDQATWNVLKEEIDYNKLIQDFWREKWGL